MILVTCLILALSVGTCRCQLHLGPIDTVLQCHGCNGGTSFPACLDPPVTCHAGEVCSISYTSTNVFESSCLDAQRCLAEIQNYDRQCTGGGVAVQDKCRRCCETNQCVKNITDLMHHVVDPGMFCPGHCSVSDTASCLSTGTRCFTEEFCRIEVDENSHVTGTCTPDTQLQKCVDDRQRQRCWIPPFPYPISSRCVVDCCSTAQCIVDYFGSQIGSFPLTVTTVVPTPVHEAQRCYETCHDSTCTNHSPLTECLGQLCMMTVEDTSSGGRTITRKCGSVALCNELWLSTSKHNPKCMQYVLTPSTLMSADVTCNFCCQGDLCNGLVTFENLY